MTFLGVALLLFGMVGAAVGIILMRMHPIGISLLIGGAGATVVGILMLLWPALTLLRAVR